MTIVEAVGWVLVHFVWQGFVIAGALAALLSLTSNAQARLRYALACGALALMLVAAVATTANVMAGVATPGDANVGASAIGSVADVAAERNAPADSASGTNTRHVAGSVRGASSMTFITGRAQSILDAAMPWIVAVWASGVLLLSVRLVGGWWRSRALRVNGVGSVPEWCHARLAALAERLRVTRTVALVSSIRVPVPIVLGHVKPVIVLPAAMLAGLSPAQIEAIIAHELAHVRRHDYLVNLAQTVVETLLFYHPAVWWVSRQIRDAREHCCDDLAVAVCESRTSYVRALLDMESLRTPAGVLALGATDGALFERARRLLVHPEQSAAAPRLAASVIALSVVASAGAAASWVPDEPPLLEAVAIEAPAQTAAATPVVVSPEGAAPLSTRWTWAERSAREARLSQYWIGYGVSVVSTLPPIVYIERSSQVFGNGVSFTGHMFSNDARGLRFSGRRLDLPGSNRLVKVLFRFDASRGTPALTAVHASSLALPVETKDLRIFWLGDADTHQSLAQVDRLYAQASMRDLQNDLIATIGLHDASAEVVQWLERRVASGDHDDLRAEATEWLAWHPIARSVTTLDRIARGDRASRVRQEAAEALGDLQMPEAATVLAKLARELDDVKARREAVEALGARSEPSAQDALASIARQDANLEIQREAVETLGDLSASRGTALLMELARTHPHIDVRREAIETLGDAAPTDDLVRVLTGFAMQDGEAGVQQEAIETLSGLDHPGALTALIEIAQSHPRTSARRDAIEALADSKDTAKVLSVLAALAKGDRDIDVQLTVVETLGQLEGGDAARQLRELARTHANERVRAQAIETLGEHASSSDDISLLKSVALTDTSEHVRDRAIETLGGLADGAGIDALVDIAREHPDARAQRRAIEALLDIDHPRAREALKLQKPARR